MRLSPHPKSAYPLIPKGENSVDDLFFGRYLVSKKIITEEQLLQVVAYQRGRNRLVGDLAVELRLLSREQVESARALQKERDLFFGDAIVELGYLNREKVDELLSQQKRNHVFIGQVVIILGFATNDDVHQALQTFEAENRAGKLAPRAANLEDARLTLLLALTQKTLTRSCNMPSRLGTRETHAKGTDVPLFRWSASCAVLAPWQGRFIFSASERVVRSILNAQGVVPAGSTDADGGALCETVIDVARTVVQLSKEPLGLKVEGEPTQIEQRTLPLGSYRAVVAELMTPFGAAHVIVTSRE